ncbi:MAG: hypothetical protein AAGL24_13325 [Pseudomonadota bacterium]
MFPFPRTLVPQTLQPLSELAATHPEIRSALVTLGHLLVCETHTPGRFYETIRYHLCRIDQTAADTSVSQKVWEAVGDIVNRTAGTAPSHLKVID